MKKTKGLFKVVAFVILCILTFNVLNINFYEKDESEENKLSLQKGYEVSTYLTGLKNPSAMTFDNDGNLYVAENEGKKGKVIKYSKNGEYKVVIDNLSAPIGYIRFDKNDLYISHKGKVTKLYNGKVTDVVNNLPSYGDYSNNGISIGIDNMIYIAQGSATNSGIVGMDNYENGWLKENPYFHDVPAVDMVLQGGNFVTSNPFTQDREDYSRTGGFLPFSTPSSGNDNIKGSVPGNASIIRANKDGSYVETFSFGVRNPKNMIHLNDGSVLVGVQGMENRGTRPVANGMDYIYRLNKGDYVGWPDYEGGHPITNSEFKVDGKKQLQMLSYNVASEVAKPIMSFSESGRIGYMDISKDDKFGYKGQLIIPFKKGKNESAKILVVNYKDKSSQEFLINKKGEEMLENPSQCLFSPEGELYILESDNGIVLKVNKENSSIGSIVPKNVPLEYILILGGIIFVLSIGLLTIYWKKKIKR